MAIITMSSREFNQHASDAKRASESGPVIITDRGRPSHVLMSIDEYKRITGGRRNIADLLTMPGVEDIDIDIPKLLDIAQPADLA